jgi:thiamine biosynthesis lipoprotein
MHQHRSDQQRFAPWAWQFRSGANPAVGSQVHEVVFRAMGSDAQLTVVGAPATVVTSALERVAELERRWSRFLPTSEVSQLTGERSVRVSADTVLLVERAIDAWRLTGGSFDPTVLGDVLRAGYDRSFELLEADTVGSPLSALRLAACMDIVIDGDVITLPKGSGFDPGGIGKGLAADLLVADVMAAGAAGVCVNLGGDLHVEGDSPDDGAWTVAVEHPTFGSPLAVLGLTRGAVATSTTLRRRWVTDGEPRHHLIDPATGQPSTSDVELVTVVAGAAWQAEVLAKACLLRGSERVFDPLPEGVEALVVTRDHRVMASEGMAPFLGTVSA